VDLDAAAVTAAVGSTDALLALAADISDPEAVARVYAATLDRFGHLDAVANVAGISILADARLEDLDVEVFDRTQRVNLRGTFLMCKAAIPALRANGGGAIINLGSVASVRGVGGPAYVSSKAGVAGLSRAIAAQYAAERIRCITVAPGPTSTPMLEIAKQKSTVNTLGAPGTIPGEADPDEVAALIEFLAGDSGRFITGALYTIDGGLTQH
jgi:NAD(P)-dependent dehydrogenase (short-subunit alcohol dehydrogenase family)